MPIEFTQQRWAEIKNNYDLWWRGELDRPLIHLTYTGADPQREPAALPFHHFTAVYGLDTPLEQVVDVIDYQLSSQRWEADGFPGFWPNFGAGVLAAFLGARVESDENTVWFFPDKDREITELRFQPVPDDPWSRRIEQLYHLMLERWQGLVQLGMTDLGGNLDVLSTFRPGEKLLLDLYDHPDAVKRLTWEAHELWWRFYEQFNRVLQPANPGYTAWAPIYSASPYYMLQCDFAYMISPQMFDEFVRPELEASCKRLVNPFYHLDGVGQLPHLDSLLQIRELKGVQWIPGDGQPNMAHWPEVYRKTHDAGKLIQLYGGPDILDAVVDQIGTARGIILMCSAPYAEREDMVRRLERYLS